MSDYNFQLRKYASCTRPSGLNNIIVLVWFVDFPLSRPPTTNTSNTFNNHNHLYFLLLSLHRAEASFHITAMQSGYHSFPASGASPILSPTKSRTQSYFAPLRPWRQLIGNLYSYTRPLSLPDLAARLRRNLYYFRVNYAVIMLLILFLSLLWHPVSMIVFLVVFVAWLSLYFFRREPLVIFNQTFEDSAVLSVLSIVTVVSLGITGVSLNVFLSVLIAGAVVTMHAAFRATEDLYLDEEEAAGGAMLPFFGSASRVVSTRVVLV